MTPPNDRPQGNVPSRPRTGFWPRLFGAFPFSRAGSRTTVRDDEAAAHDPAQAPSQSRVQSPSQSSVTKRHALTKNEERHWHLLRGLLPFVWPHDRPDLRRRVVLAAIVLVIAKVITVLVPIFFKEATDTLTAATKDPNAAMLAGVAMWASAMVVGYGVGRIVMMVLTQVRDVLFTAVGQNAVRALNNRTFRHLHQLSLRFHLERRTGGVSRVIERATRAIELIMRTGVLNLLPTLLEFVLIAGVLLYFFNWIYLVVVTLTVVLYMWFTLSATEWRITIRREMNESDTDANTKAIDSLLNYETVKYFGNEEMEQRRFDHAMARYEKAAIQTYYSLGVLNAGQAIIFTIGMTICMVMAARGVTTGVHTVGDFVMINALLIQLYIPLNFMGFVYREIRQGLVDVEMMFTLLEEPEEIKDTPDAAPLRVTEGRIEFRDVNFHYDPERPILQEPVFRGAGRWDAGNRRPIGCWQVNHQPHPVPLLRGFVRQRINRRPGHSRCHTKVAAQRDRHGPARHRAV